MYKRLLILSLILLLVLPLQAQDADRTQRYGGLLDNVVAEKSYEVQLSAGEHVLITATALPNSDIDTYLTLYGPNGEQVAENDDRSLSTYDSAILYEVETSGTYKIVVSRYDDTTSGRYELVIETGNVNIYSYPVTLSGERLWRDTQHFRIHYTLTGEDRATERYVDYVVEALEESWQVQIEELGYNPPPTDGSMGGNALYDVYIRNLIGTEEDALGYASPQELIGDNPATEQVEQFAATSYLAVDNDFYDIDLYDYQTELGVLRATIAHEFHHAVQFGYDALEPHNWYSEATSTWMETVTMGDDQDATGYVEYAFTYPELCFGTEADPDEGLLMYGEWTLFEHLATGYGQQIVRELWENLIDLNDFDALEATFEAYETDISNELARYRLRNFARDYDLATLFYSSVWLEDTISNPGYVYDGVGVQALGANYFAFEPRGVFTVDLRGDGDLEVWGLGVGSDKIEVFRLGNHGTFDSARYREYYLMVFNRGYADEVNTCEYAGYDLDFAPGSEMPVSPTWALSARYFEPPSR